MKSISKIVLGLLTLSPILVFVMFIAGIPLSMLAASSRAIRIFPLPAFFLMFSLVAFSIFLSYALTALYIVNVFRSTQVDKDKKALWAVVIFLGWSVAQIVYWYLYIWRDPKPSPSALSTSGPGPIAPLAQDNQWDTRKKKDNNLTQSRAKKRGARVDIKKVGKLAFGLASVMPALFYLAIFLAILISILSTPSKGPIPRQGRFPLETIISYGTVASYVLIAVLVIYLASLLFNKRIDRYKKALWAAILFLGWPIAPPVYWYLYIWREPHSATPLLANTSQT